MLEIKCKEHLVHKCTILMAILIILLCLHPIFWTELDLFRDRSNSKVLQYVPWDDLQWDQLCTIAQNYRLLASRQYRQEYTTFTL